MKQVECDALKQTTEYGDKKHGILEEALKSATDENAQLVTAEIYVDYYKIYLILIRL